MGMLEQVIIVIVLHKDMYVHVKSIIIGTSPDNSGICVMIIMALIAMETM